VQQAENWDDTVLQQLSVSADGRHLTACFFGQPYRVMTVSRLMPARADSAFGVLQFGDEWETDDES
jgi:hypothetical protein